MYYEEEFHCEPPSEFETRINKLIQEEVSVRMGDAAIDLEQLKKQAVEQKEIIKTLRTEISNLNRLKKSELEQALKEKELEIKRDFGHGFAVNDEVYFVGSKSTHVKCDKCEGRGKVNVEILGKETTVNCPHCKSGKISNFFYEPKKDRIEAIEFYVTRKSYNNKTCTGTINAEIYLAQSEFFKTPKFIYKTLEECQAVCDEQNKEVSPC